VLNFRGIDYLKRDEMSLLCKFIFNPTFASVGVLGLIVLVRTFLSWSLEVEIDGLWPWDRAKLQKGHPADPNEI
jgi:hypothetical protein